MTNRKLVLLAAIPVMLLLGFFATTFAFHLLSAPSDASVVAGVVVLSALLFIFLKFIVYLTKTFR